MFFFVNVSDPVKILVPDKSYKGFLSKSFYLKPTSSRLVQYYCPNGWNKVSDLNARFGEREKSENKNRLSGLYIVVRKDFSQAASFN